MKRIAIVAASGIGDALLMQISAAALQELGYETVTVSKHLPSLASWFPGFSFAASIQADTFDAIVLQHDNSPLAKELEALPIPVYRFYGEHSPIKHGALRATDVVFDRTLPMAHNIAQATAKLFPGARLTMQNGLVPPAHYRRGKYGRRVILHPTSTSLEKSWLRDSFLTLQDRLAREGWDPVFIAPPEEAYVWNGPVLPTLADLAAWLYESRCLIGNDSGPGHLASNLGLPTLIIGPSREHLALWRPGWTPGEIAHPPRWASYFKATRTKWKHFVSVSKVLKIFNKLKLEI